MTCGTCRWWERRQPNKHGAVWGDCKRFPPTPVNGAIASPTVKSDDWCGEHKIVRRGQSWPTIQEEPA